MRTLSIDGFKCFSQKTSFEINDITLLTGANSTGKSSVIQSLLLSKIISEATALEDTNQLYINLNDKQFALDLGHLSDIVNRDSNTDTIRIFIDNASFEFGYNNNENENSSIVNVSIDTNYKNELYQLFAAGFCYLSAERLGPRYEYEISSSPDFCGCHGEKLGDVINKHALDDGDDKRSLLPFNNRKWTVLLNEWIDYIFPGTTISIEQTGKQMYQIKEHKNVNTNVGFGITYALPIIVSALLIQKNGLLIIENPEAHLHAKAQSNMGYFIAQMAASGVQIIVETHSEHIVNGIRRFVVKQDSSLSANQVSIYFFQKKNNTSYPLNISIDDWGNLSDFPVDFFDQVRQDMKEIMELGRSRKSI